MSVDRCQDKVIHVSVISAIRSRDGGCLGDVVGWQKEARSERTSTETGRKLAGEHQRQESTVVHCAVGVCCCVRSSCAVLSSVETREYCRALCCRRVLLCVRSSCAVLSSVETVLSCCNL